MDEGLKTALWFQWYYECDKSWREELDEESRRILDEWDRGHNVAWETN